RTTMVKRMAVLIGFPPASLWIYARLSTVSLGSAGGLSAHAAEASVPAGERSMGCGFSLVPPAACTAAGAAKILHRLGKSAFLWRLHCRCDGRPVPPEGTVE